MSDHHERNKYSIAITVNSRKVISVEISQHYQKSHSESINDGLIIDLIKLLDGGSYQVDSVQGEFKFYKTFLDLNNKRYKLVWTLEDDKLYIGVLTAHRSEQKG